MKRSSQAWTLAGLLIGIGVIIGAVVGATQTDKGRELTAKAGKKASDGLKQAENASERIGGFASDFWNEARDQTKHESGALAQAFYDFLGRMKAHGSEIDTVHVYLTDGSIHEIDPKKLDDATARGLMGKSHRI